ncbi:hypothetical protein ALC56_03522 [Trachymyrmex septentrionalis]|uniref:Endonuclease/exonuclease/phosphatase domain-containing protein n=1 Tax=Trachymyrmex septentrionalis TaxID=34720 RepID=A0A151JZE6_9HYME|nr:hypothetical protein ALC56_03522 [Trachymyrmex septentrionalis]
MKDKMPEGWRWKCQVARREGKMGRAKGGIVTGVRRELVEREIGYDERDGIQEREVVIDRERWRFVIVYNREGQKEGLEALKEVIKEEEEGILMIAGDFNARIGGEEGWNRQSTEGDVIKEEASRDSKDKVVNKQGRDLMEVVEERGWMVLNGVKEGDEKGEWTYEKGGGRSVIDLGIVNWEAWERVGRFEVGCRGESDHQPIMIELGTYYEREEERRGEELRLQDWSVEGIGKYRTAIEKIEWKGGGVRERWEELEREINKAVEYKKRGKRKGIGWSPWWDAECRKKKREMNRLRRRVRRARVAMGWVWSYGERKFKGDIRWRLKLFDSIVKGILLYGVEMWGYREWKEVEAIHEKYLKWILGLEKVTPGYIVREELKRNKLRVETGWRAGKFEEKLEKGEGGKFGKMCMIEKRKSEREKDRREWTKESIERGNYLWRGGMSEAAMNECGENKWECLRERDIEVDVQERGEEVRASRSCVSYRRVYGIPMYIRTCKRNEGKRLVKIARWRCGNEERGNKYWLNEEERKCRLCERERENVDHLKNKCVYVRERGGRNVDGGVCVLNEDGRGIGWMEMIERLRRDREREGERERERERGVRE